MQHIAQGGTGKRNVLTVRKPQSLYGDFHIVGGLDDGIVADRLKHYTSIDWSDSPEQVRFYHFFQCAKGSKPPTHTILGWTKKSQEYHSHAKKKDSVLRYLPLGKGWLRYIPGSHPSYFIVEESFPTGLIRAKRQGFRGVFNPKFITFPKCVHRFTTSQLGSK